MEYRLWDEGKFRPTFKELFDYFLGHPDVCGLPENLKGIGELKSHYKHLSSVVHSSGREFRMSNEIDGLKLWDTSVVSVGKWSTSHKNVLRDVNLLILALFYKHLRGAAYKGLRESLSLVIPPARDAIIKSSLAVKIIR